MNGKVYFEQRDQVTVIHVENAQAQASISLFGGHVLSFKPKKDKRERLWVSENSHFDSQHPIRGGIPVCWPWFAAHPDKNNQDLPSHGWLRTQTWQLTHISYDDSETELTLKPSSMQGVGFNGNADVTLSIRVGERLALNLITRNMGDKSFDISCALHSYFAVKDIGLTSLQGINGQYKDKLQKNQLFATPLPYRFKGETDRIHLEASKQVVIDCQGASTKISSSGHDSIVVWNPWSAKSSNMADMTADGYKSMVCVETAVTSPRALAPGTSHSVTQVIR